MKIYLLVSVTKDGKKGLVGHYPYDDEHRSEVYATKELAEIHQERMIEFYGRKGMMYNIVEVDL